MWLCVEEIGGREYRIAGNIGGEFNLAVWRMSGRSAKLNSAKYSADRDADLIPIPVYRVVLGVRHDNFATFPFPVCPRFF